MTYHTEKSGLQLIEEAVHLVRSLSLSFYAAYYIGTLPFIAAFLYYWTEMSFSASTQEQHILSALGIAILFLWMKCWHSVFCTLIQSYLNRAAPVQWTMRRLVNLIITQVSIQPSGLFVIPLSLLLTLPFPWVYAFYQNVTAFAYDDKNNGQSIFQRSRKMSVLWPKQNHLILFILFLFGTVVFINFAVAIFTFPYLLKTFFDIETVFSRNSNAIFNSTYFAVTWALTYSSVDPLIKVIYCLRCFYGEAQTTGQDLRASLKKIIHENQRIIRSTVIFVVSLFTITAALYDQCSASLSHEHQTSFVTLSSVNSTNYKKSSSSLQPLSKLPSSKPNSSFLHPSELNKAINETLKKREYIWRLPKPDNKKVDEEKGFLMHFFLESIELLEDIAETLVRWKRKFDNWLNPSPDGNINRVNTKGWKQSVRGLFYFFLFALLLYLLFFMYRTWRKYYNKPGEEESGITKIIPDISDDNITADKLSTDRWMAMGRELAEKGQLRLALRAFYLGTLSFLGHSGIITIARFKSNRDYQKQLERRMGERDSICELFSQNVNVFNRVWYGFYEVTQNTIDDFIVNHERIREQIQK